MDCTMNRREFMGTVGSTAAASVALTESVGSVSGAAHQATGGSHALVSMTPHAKVVLQPFDYMGVTLRSSRWQRRVEDGRDVYMSFSTDDVLKGFRQAAGLDAPGTTLGGWCRRDSYTVFGQWLQAMSRMSRATNDSEMLERAGVWVTEWSKAWNVLVARGPGSGGESRSRGRGAGGPPGLVRHYPYEKLVGGLVDMHHYGGHPEALEMAGKITEVAAAGLNRERTPAHREPWILHSGRPLEWYTLGENLYRAYQVSGDSMFKEFADVWLYHAYWDRFADTNDPKGAQGVHAYSHCNSFSTAAMAYDVTGDEKYLTVMKNFYDWLQRRQTYATGGYGPNERYVFSDGALGESLEFISSSFECPCCNWAAFKLAKYLMLFTGESRYGDWIERLFYNGIGAALPILKDGRHFYYADYHLGADLKYHSRSNFTCCSGTYFQNIAEFSNLVYFKNAGGLYVNLYLPSEVSWEGPNGTVRLVQTTAYPEAETSSLRLAMERPARFALNLRVPEWSRGMSARVNGTAQTAVVAPGTWTTIEREWQSGDTVEVTVPLRFRRVPIDEYHPNRIAIARGPLVYAQEDVHKWLSDIPANDDDLNRLMKPLDNDPAVFQIANEPVVGQRNAFQPYYRFGPLARHRMYFDSAHRRVLW
jgi:DUF1680 family protein